jgi:hypothetical protein
MTRVLSQEHHCVLTRTNLRTLPYVVALCFSHFYMLSQLCVSHIILCESTSQCFALLLCCFKKLQIDIKLVVSCFGWQNILCYFLFMGCYGYSDVWKFHNCLAFVIQYYSCSMMYALLGTVPCFIHRILITSQLL